MAVAVNTPSPGRRVEKKPSLWRKRLLKETDESEVVPAIEKLTLLGADDKVFEKDEIETSVDGDDSPRVISSPYSHDSICESAKKYDSDVSFSLYYSAIVNNLKSQGTEQRRFISLKSLQTELETKREFYPKPLPGKILRELKKKLEKHDVDASFLESKLFRKEAQPGHAARKRHQDKGTTFNTNSLWHMLATYDEFIVTKPHFNIYDEKSHWLDQRPLPWIIQENSRKKCVRWLAKNFE